MLLLTLLLLLMPVVMPMPMREVLWERLGCSSYTCFHVFGSCWEPLGASCSISTCFTCLGVSEDFWGPRMPNDAQGCPRMAQEASRAAKKLLHTCFCVSERPMTLNPTCFTVPERPQEAPGGSFIREFTCGSSPPGERVGGAGRGCGSLVFCMFCVENV